MLDITDYERITQNAKQLADYRSQLLLAIKRNKAKIEKDVDLYVAKVHSSLSQMRIRTESDLESLEDAVGKQLSPFGEVKHCTDIVYDRTLRKEESAVPVYMKTQELHFIYDLLLSYLVSKLNIAIEEKNGN